MGPEPNSDSDPQPRPPPKPEEGACCGQGCDPCILDYYADEMKRYEVALRAWQERHR